MKNIIICDDSLLESKITQEILVKFISERNLFYDVSVENNGEDFIDKCKKGDLQPDIVFMDIELGEKSGIDIANMLNEMMPQCIIIYLSNYLEYSLDVYSTEHQYYILKSQLPERIEDVFGKIDSINRQRNQVVKVELKYNQVINIPMNDICCLERRGRKTLIITTEETYETYQHLDDLAIGLNEDFVRCHNSYVVNMRKISSYKRERISLQRDVEIPVSRQYQRQVKDTFMEWSKRNLL